MDIKPIRTEEDYRAAMEEINRLFDAEPGTPEGDRLDVLVTLVEVFEKEHYYIPLPDPIEAIKYHMERLSLSSHDLEPYIGSRTRVWEILNRKRPLSMRMIRNLNKALGLSLDVLIQDYKLDEETYKAEKYYIGLSINSRLEETIRNGPNSGMTYVIAAPKIGKSYFLTSEARNKTQNQTLGFYDELEKNFIVSVVSEKIEDVLSEYHITVGEHWLDLIRKVRDEAATNATLVKTL